MTTAQWTLDGRPWQPEPPANEPARRVLAVLLPGETVTRERLTDATGLSDRQARQAVEDLRCAGWPIASSTRRAGYRLSLDPSDWAETERNLRSRVRTMLRTLRVVRQARERQAAA